MTQTSPQPLLTTDRISKRYKDTLANREITVELPRGHIVGIVGENGSGKTTLFRILTGLTRPTSGTFTYHGEDGKVRIGAIVESPAYWPTMSASDNLLYQARLTGSPADRIPEILETVGLAGTGRKKAKRFSLGMRQRLGIAIALLSKPDLLILDEPTNGLDPQGIVEMRSLLQKLTAEQHMTMLISSHILTELAQMADVFWFIRKGSVIRTVTSGELLKRSDAQIRFRCTENAEEALVRIVRNGWAEKAVPAKEADGWHVLTGPNDLGSILTEIAPLRVTDLSTQERSLEDYYLQLMAEVNEQ